MSIFAIMHGILIGPLYYLFELIFGNVYYYINNAGLSILVLSLMINLLLLPLYIRADAMQIEARNVEEKLKKGEKHIKKTFSGDERMMILQTYYRQNNYKPTDALKGSVSLLLQIPFFIAAYQFLSSIVLLKGKTFGPINDLSLPDALINISGIDINIMPILMTVVNLISGIIYTKGHSGKTKVQVYVLALLFLVLLYNSPAGLVLYWTCNNLFSLIKNIFSRLKNPKKYIKIGFYAICIMGLMGVLIKCLKIFKISEVLCIVLVLALITILFLRRKKDVSKIKREKDTNYDNKIFLLGIANLTILIGLLIPSALLATSPKEFIDITYCYNPLEHLLYSFCVATGTFLIWMKVFYWLAKPATKVVFDKVILILYVVSLVNYLLFGTKLGIISTTLKYENGLYFSDTEIIINILAILLIALVMNIIIVKYKKKLSGVFIIAAISMLAMSGANIAKVQKDVSVVLENPEILEEKQPHFTLSKNGKNVVVIMMDRSIGLYVPYIFNEKPELKEQFDGFTYYSNTISFGGYTNFGTPGLFGGYEYTPIEMNKRDDELLVSKHNEALKIMPLIFSEQGYDVTVCDPPYANYSMVPDLSIYDEYPEINAYNTCGYFIEPEQKEYNKLSVRRSFFGYGLMKTMPLCLQELVYDNGRYNRMDTTDKYNFSTQKAVSLSNTVGVCSLFMEWYSVLIHMNDMTHISDDSTNNFFMMSNKTTHEPMILQMPEYTVAYEVDNSEYFNPNSEIYTIDGKTLNLKDELQVRHYHTNMAVMIQLGQWLEYLKENDVYDNTRIIIVSDHAKNIHCLDEFKYSPDLLTGDLGFYFPLLLVKDFDAEGFSTSDEFMTNADVPTIAFSGLVDEPVNPFTGKVINNDEKTAHKQYISLSYEYTPETNNGTTYVPSAWYSVEDDIWDLDNWTYYGEFTTMPEGAE